MKELEKKEEKKDSPSALTLYKRDVIDAVAAKVRQYISNGELNLPAGYSVNNAIKSAWLILQTTTDRDKNPALQVCTRTSVANALLDMIIQGLNPIKKQNYFIVYGKTLVCMRSYFGTMAVAKMVTPKIDDFAYNVVYRDDKFKYGIVNGKKMVTLHEQDIENVDKAKIVAAYCIALDKDGNVIKTEIMTFEEIKQSWKQSIMKPVDDKGDIKSDSTHSKFIADMALRTVINKACKAIINSSRDNALLLERINKSEDVADEAATQEEIDDNANKDEVLEIEGAATVIEPPKDDLWACPDAGIDVAMEQCKQCSTFKSCATAIAKTPKPAKKNPGF